MKQKNDIKVFISNRESSCDECKEELGRRAWITLDMQRQNMMSYWQWVMRDGMREMKWLDELSRF